MFADCIKKTILPATWAVIGVKKGPGAEMQGGHRGTAFAIDGKGRLLTCWHVMFMDGDCTIHCDSFVVAQPDVDINKQYQAKLVAEDRDRDLAVIEIVGPISTKPIALVGDVVPWGRSCCALGHPLSLLDQGTQSMRIFTRAAGGIVSMPYNAPRFPGTSPVRLYELDFFAHGGASGGAVFLRGGEVFAVVSGSQLVDHGTGNKTRSNLAIAIDSREAIEFLKALSINPQVRRGVR